MTADPRAALLREFVRRQIPQECASVAGAIVKAQRSRKARFLLDLRELRRRQSPYHRDFLRKSDFDAAVKQLNDAYERDRADIAENPERPHFQTWRAADADWRTLAIGLAFERDPSSFGLEHDDSCTGDDHWYFDMVMGNAVKETNGNASRAAPIAAKYINGRIEAGEFTRQSAENPKEHVEAGTLRTGFSARAAARSRLLRGMISDSLEAFMTWAHSTECPVVPATVAEILPSNATADQWVEDEKAIAAQFRRFRAERTPASDGEDQAIYEEFYAGLTDNEKDEFSSWGRLQAHFDEVGRNIRDPEERKSFHATCGALITSFLQHRYAVNDGIMDDIAAVPPSYIRYPLHVQDCFRAAKAAGESLSVREEL